MKNLLVMALMLSGLAHAVEFTKFNSYEECQRIREELFQQDLKRPRLTGIPKHWIMKLDGGFRYEGIPPGVVAPDNTFMSGAGAIAKGNKVIHFSCPQPNFVNGKNPPQWIAISTFEEDAERYAQFVKWQANEKTKVKEFIKSKGL